MRDHRSAFMLVNTHEGTVPAWAVPQRWTPPRDGQAEANPRPLDGCVLWAKCGNMATSDSICGECAATYRHACLRCGKKLNDAAVDAGHGHCLTCWRAMKGYERNGYISSGNGRKA